MQLTVSWAQLSNDCVNAIVVCGNSTIESNVSGFGVQELDNEQNSCFFEEVNSIWFKLYIAESGSLSFTLIPDETDISVDYDFYIFGPSDSCGDFNDPIRCSTTNPDLAGASNNHTGLRDNENDTYEGPAQSGNSFVSSLDVTMGETYYLLIDRPHGNGGFNLEWAGSAKFNDPPLIIGDPTPIELCLASLDTQINLKENGNQITTSPSVKLVYFESFANALDNQRPILHPESYKLKTAQTIIYIKVTNDNGCFEILELPVSAVSFINESFSYIACDQDGNGTEFFQLSNIHTDVLNTLNNSADYTLSFHHNKITADSNSNMINPVNYSSVSTTIYARISSNVDTFCFLSLPIELIVRSSPIPLVSQLLQCDIDKSNSTDGISALNLEQVFGSLSNDENYTFFFYESIQNRNNNIPIPNPIGYTNTQPFNQTIYYKVIQNTCENIGEIQIQVQPTTISLTPQSPFYTCNENIDNTNISGTFDLESIRLLNYPNIETNFYISLSDVTLEKNPLSGNYTTSEATTAVYVRIENSNQCQGVEEFELIVNPVPTFTINESYVLCTDGAPFTLTGPEGFDNYKWYKIDGTTDTEISNKNFATFSEVGNYYLKVEYIYNNNGKITHCSNKEFFRITPSNKAFIQDIIIKDISKNNSVQIMITGDGDYEYSINGINYQDSNIFTNVTPGIITVYINDKNNCGITEKTISIIGYPNFFTPNGDGINDFWQIIGINAQLQSKSVITIYNRYGALMAQISPTEKGWDGKSNELQLISSDYWFSVTLEDGRIFKGHFALKR